MRICVYCGADETCSIKGAIAAMKLLDILKVKDNKNTEHSIELWHGDLAASPSEQQIDLTALPREERTKMLSDKGADILFVSAFPNDYKPTPKSLIGALHRKGISVRKLARVKFEDKRKSTNCWISKELRLSSKKPACRRIICYEFTEKIPPAVTVGNVFRCLASYAGSEIPISTIAMPMLATGDAGEPVAVMLVPLLKNAVKWLQRGLPIQRLKIVEFDKEKALEIKGAFSAFKIMHRLSARRRFEKKDYDIFMSYCHKNAKAADYAYKKLTSLGKKVFMDRIELKPGMAWQEEIFNALIKCRNVMLLYSRSYMNSRNCQEEFNIAQLLHINNNAGLFPVYLYSVKSLPQYMTHWQYRDCRAADRNKLRSACEELVKDIESCKKTFVPRRS